MQPRDIREALVRRERRREASLSAQRHASRQAAEDLATMLAARGASRVVLFGSLVTGGGHEASDIDMAVEGLSADVYFEALGELLMAAPCKVDLVRLEDAPTSLRAHIATTGVVLHGG
jgi:uncharacterized protein